MIVKQHQSTKDILFQLNLAWDPRKEKKNVGTGLFKYIIITTKSVIQSKTTATLELKMNFLVPL